MSDDPNAGGSASGGEELHPEGGAPEAGGAPENAGGSLSALANGADDAAGNQPAWGEGWREALAGDDAKELARLKRMGSPADLHKAYRQLEKRMSSGQTAAALPEDATPEDVAAYRKAHGIPETPDGYGISFPEGSKPSEADNKLLQGFLADMHGRHVPPGAAKAAFEWYQQRSREIVEAQAAAAKEAMLEAQVELRKEYGAELKRNMRLADEFLDKYPGLSAAIDLDRPNPAVLKDLVRLAREMADEESLIGGDGAGGGKSIEDEIGDLVSKSVEGKLTKAEDARLNQLFEAQVARDEKRGRARAA